MKFSLILSTKGRTDEIARLFDGFKAQTFQNFEIIVSDQNEDDRVLQVLAPLKSAWEGRLTHLRSSGGLSRARNTGLAVAQGEIVAFPDDDCVYPPSLLEEVAKFFDTHPQYGYLSGRSFFDDGGDAASSHSKVASSIQRFRIYQQCMEFALFVRRSSLGSVRFDENMGVGSTSPWQADEGPDLMLSLESEGVRGYYDPQFGVWHPRMALTYDAAMIQRCYRYACGSGYFLRKHHYPFWFFAKLNGRTFLGVLLGLLTFNPGKAAYYWARFRGRWRGWNGWQKIQTNSTTPL